MQCRTGIPSSLQKNRNVLLTIYNTQIITTLELWDSYIGFNSDRILRIQKKAVRSITLSKFDAHTEPRFITLKLLKMKDIIKWQTLKFCCKLINGNLPVYFNHDDLYSRISNIHCYNTRRLINSLLIGQIIKLQIYVSDMIMMK